SRIETLNSSAAPLRPHTYRYRHHEDSLIVRSPYGPVPGDLLFCNCTNKLSSPIVNTNHSRFITAICGMSLTVLALSGCGRTSAEPAGAIDLSVWSMWSGQEEKNFLAVLQRYHELHPNIFLENLGAIRDDTKTFRSIVAGVPPDMFT